MDKGLTNLSHIFAIRHWLVRQRGWLSLLLGAALSAGFIALAFRQVDWRSVYGIVAQARIGWLLLALVSVVVTAWWRAARWRLLLGRHATGLGVGPFLGALWAGQALNALIPARLGELARALLIADRGGIGKGEALWSLVMEKLLDALTLIVFVAGLSLSAPLPDWLRSASLVFSAISLSALGVLLAAERWRGTVHAKIDCLQSRHPLIGRLRPLRILEIVAEGGRLLRNARIAWRLMAWSLACYLMAALTNALVALALGIRLPPSAAMLLLAVLQSSAIAPLPTLPGRAGLFHYLCIITLAIYGVAPEPAMGYALVLHLLVYLPMALGGPWGLRRGHHLSAKRRPSGD